MITLRLHRPHVEDFNNYFSPYINLQKQTRMNDVGAESIISEKYLSAVTINCIITEVQDLFIRKLVTTRGPIIKFHLSDAQATVLFKTLIHLGIHKENIYLQTFRNQWIQVLERELQQLQLLHLQPYHG